MNWIVFAVAAWLALGFEVGFRQALQIGHLNVAPSFVMILLAFVSLWARPVHAAWTAVLLGAALDLISMVPASSGDAAVVVGPWAIGCLLASYTALNFRAMMFRKHPLALAFVAGVGTALANLLVLSLLVLRAKYDVISIPFASVDLWQRLGTAAYTALAALVLAPLLNALGPWLGFRQPLSLGRRG